MTGLIMNRALIAALAFLAAGCGKKKETDPLETFGRLIGSEEHVVIGRIRSAATPEEREKQIRELEALPVKIYPFHSRWSVIHDVSSYDGWTDEGYDAAAGKGTRDIQLLEATGYGISDIQNGGLHQFFGNSTGAFAPEMVEWFERAGLPQAATVLKQAMAKFGEPYPRSQEARQKFLDSIPWVSREESDPFRDLDGPFYDAVEEEGRDFDILADRWLIDVCGIKDLRTPPPGAGTEQGR
jgi:hypothetical protein